MSTSTALTIVGAGVGFVATGGNPAGAQWGAMIGGTIGGLMQANATHMRGPRLADLTIQKSEEGAPIPVLFGAVRVAGNVLQCSEKRERAHKTSAGKGSGPKTTNYTYDVDLAVEICGTTDPLTGANAPIIGVRRIWANGNLIYDTSPGASAASLLASGKAAANIVIYAGTETQLPDPTLEALTGVGTTPAYRGKAYVVFTALQLADFGNSIPNFTFEVIASGSQTPYRRLAVATLPQKFQDSYGNNLGVPTIYSADDGVVRAGVAGGVGGTTYIYGLDGSYLGREVRGGNESQWPIAEFYADGKYHYGIGRLWDGKALYARGSYRQIIGAGPVMITGGVSMITGDASGGLPAGRQFLSACLSADGRYILSITAPGGSSAGSSSGDRWHLTEWTGVAAMLVDEGNVVPPVGEYWFNRDPYHGAMMEANLEWIWDSYSAGMHNVTLFRLDRKAKVLSIAKNFYGSAADAGNTTPSFCKPAVWADGGICVTIGGDQLNVHTRLPAVEPSPIPLSGVVSKLCARAGLADADLDVSGLDDTLHGYAISTQTSARAALEPLRQYSPFDVTEADGKLQFVPRGGQVAATIPWDDLAAHDGGDRPDPLEITVADEAEVISGVTVVFPDPDASYQPSAQAARRNRVALAGQSWQVPASVNEQRTELPICMTPARGARIAEQLLWKAYTARKTAKFAVGIKYAALRPSDVVIIVGPDATYRLRITRITESGLLRQLEAVAEDAALYTAAPASAPSAGVPAQSVAVAGPTRMMLLDIPLLRDADNGPGFYAAAGRYLPGWPGATIYASADAGRTWDEVQTFANSATLGSTEDALPAWAGGNIFDESSRVTVRIAPGLQLASIAADAVLAGGNAALLGNEIVQFRSAELIGAGLYRLSGLLRGRRGTEWAMATHAAGERFVLLSGVAGLARVVSTAADIGATRSYKAITAGESLDSASAVDFSDTGVGLKPLAPVHINAGRDAAGNIIITWVRRTRIDGEWRDYADASLGEASERYEVDVYVGGASVATLSSMAPSVTWTVADQRAAAGLPVSSMLVRVYQISAVVGRGYPGNATITLPPSVIMLPDAPTGDPSLPAGYMRDSSIVHYKVVAAAGSTPIAVVVDSGPTRIRYFSSTDNGATWAQLGAEVSSGPMPSTVDEWMCTLSDGTYVGFNAEDRNTPGAVPKIFRGTAAAAPIYTGAQLLGGAWPYCIAADGLNCYIVTENARVWKSADKGSTWQDLGPLGGEFSLLVRASGVIAGRVRLLKAPSGWVLESVAMYNDAFEGTGTQKAILRTANAEPVDGWVTSLDLRSNMVYLDNAGRIGRVGNRLITRTEGNSATGRQSIFWVSSDSGLTWASTVINGQTFGGIYLGGLSGPHDLAGTPAYLEDGGRGYITYSGSAWTPQTATGRPVFSAYRGVISTGTALVSPASTEQGYSMWRSTGPAAWTISTGITLD